MNPTRRLLTFASVRRSAKAAGARCEVYRATDTKLKREVALKILPDAVARDPGRMARFGREAQVLASLNHPNIAAIHELEESEGKRTFVFHWFEDLRRTFSASGE